MISGARGNYLAHGLQKFFRSFPSFPDESDKAIDFLVKIYDLEREAKEKGLTGEARRSLRKEKSSPILDRFFSYLKTLNPPPRSQLGKAIKYCIERKNQLSLFIEDGNLEVDNNKVESLFRDVKLGFKNFLFVQSDLGGEALAGFYSLIASCELARVNPASYLADVLIKIASNHPQSQLDELLPWNWTPCENPLEIKSEDEYLEQDYPVEMLVKKLKLGNKVLHSQSSSHEIIESPGHSPPVKSQYY